MDAIKKAIQNFIKSLRRPFRSTGKLSRAWARVTPRGRLVLLGGTAALVALLLFFVLRPAKRRALEEEAAAVFAGTAIDITPPPTPVCTLAPTPEPTTDPGFQRGVENEIVQVIQERLMDLGYLELDESTQRYGSQTEDAVKLFQRQLNFTEGVEEKVVEDGICGAQTLNYLFSDNAPHYIVKFGMAGEDITSMQMQLRDLGYMSATTGYFGEKTVVAMKEFQGRNGLAQDGLAGNRSFELLYSPNARQSVKLANAARTKANINKVIEVARSKMGCKYVLGNTGPNSFDCSGLVYYCLKQAGSNRRRLNAAGYSQVSDWEKISSMSKLKKGDLIFFYNNAFSKVGHVGIVVGSGTMIDASSSNGKVVRRSFDTTYWKKHFVCGRRPW